MNYIDARERYLRDPHFKTIVDQMTAMAMDLQMSPGELREAAIFAEIKFYASRPVHEVFPTFAADLLRSQGKI